MYVGTCYMHSQAVMYINQHSQATIYINQHVPKCTNTFFINMFTNSQFTIQMAPTWSGVHNISANMRATYVNSTKATTKLLHEDHFIPGYPPTKF
jgi:hypothetical protein